jgi:hypothetical protein
VLFGMFVVVCLFIKLTKKKEGGKECFSPVCGSHILLSVISVDLSGHCYEFWV